jgi:predicted TPR repeat methyltransferase
MTLARVSSGDTIADRRFAYAEDYFAGGDAAAARELAREALTLVPAFAPGWFRLGEWAEAAGDAAEARDAYARALALAPDDALGVAPRLAALNGVTPATLPPAHVAALFDAYAPRFDAHLVDALGYRGPEVVLAALDAVAPGRRFESALDLGCGTGLMARALAGRVAAIDGVDLSTAMVEKARATGLYRALHTAEMVAALADEAPGARDLALAADVLVYVGDLAPVIAGAARALRPGGLFAATLQAGPEPYALLPDRRFGHGEAYVRATISNAGLSLRHLAPVSTRRDRGVDVPGLVVVAERLTPPLAT